jgi:hypothetical protein
MDTGTGRHEKGEGRASLALLVLRGGSATAAHTTTQQHSISQYSLSPPPHLRSGAAKGSLCQIELSNSMGKETGSRVPTFRIPRPDESYACSQHLSKT